VNGPTRWTCGRANRLVTILQPQGTTAISGIDRFAWPIDRFARHVLLLFRHPGRFARFVAPRLGRPWLGLMTLTYGLEFAISGLGKDAAREKPVFAPATWPEWWAWAIGLSLFSGVLITALGDVFFRLRIALAGAAWPESGKVFRVYLAVAQIGALPAILVRLGETCFYATPREAESGWATLVVALVFAVWVQVAEYRATILAFGASPLRARIVFLWLPIGLAILIVVAAELFG
jgi:hypothetical protein